MRFATCRRWASEEDDAVVQQARVDVVGPLAPVGLLDDGGDQVVADGSLTTRGSSADDSAIASVFSGSAVVGIGGGGLGFGGFELGRGEIDRIAVFVDHGRVLDEEGKALLRSRSDRTAWTTPLRSRSLRTFAGFSPRRSASWSISASTSASVTSIASCATTARNARSARTAPAAPSRTPSTNAC